VRQSVTWYQRKSGQIGRWNGVKLSLPLFVHSGTEVRVTVRNEIPRRGGCSVLVKIPNSEVEI